MVTLDQNGRNKGKLFNRRRQEESVTSERDVGVVPPSFFDRAECRMRKPGCAIPATVG